MFLSDLWIKSHRVLQLKYYCQSARLRWIIYYNLFQIIGTTRKVALENLQFKLSGWYLLSKCAWISIVYIYKVYGSIEDIEKNIFYKKWFFFTLQILAIFRSWRALGALKASLHEAKFHIEVGAPASIWLRIWLISKKMKI